jgi:hypothetical protein
MKKCFVIMLTLLFALNANSAFLNPDRTGQVLIYPYYTSNGSNQSLLSVVNTKADNKALKVRFFDGKNAVPVFSFNVYLAPRGMWTAGIFDGALINQPSTIVLRSFETNCVPGLPQRPLSNLLLTEAVATRSVSNSGEGYVEIIEMASYPNSTRLSTFSCQRINDAFAQNDLFADSVGPPTGGLTGNLAIVNSGEGSYINYAATTIDGFRESAMHTLPGDLLPNLASAKPESMVFIGGKLVRSSWLASTQTLSNGPGTQIDAVSALFAADELINEFNKQTGFAGLSEWVVSFPTRRFYTSGQFDNLADVPPFISDGGIPPNPGCLTTQAIERDRQGIRFRFCLTAVCIPGFDNQRLKYCNSVNVVRFGGNSSQRILGSNLEQSLGFSTPAGTFSLKLSEVAVDIPPFTREMRPSLEGHRFHGLPAIGFWALQIQNLQAVPNKFIYGGAVDHVPVRRCTLANGDAC